jgi:dihydroflavonol-4-reductase
LTTNGVSHDSPGRDRVFLTGATGFVGSHILKALLETGFTVRALVRPETVRKNDSAYALSLDGRANARGAEDCHPERSDPERAQRVEGERSRRTATRQSPEPTPDPTSRAHNSAGANGHAASTNVEYIPGDLTRPGDLVEALKDCRYLIHCAALYSFNPRDRAASYQVNVTGTAGLLEAAYLAGVERCILTSSSATLGHSHRDRPADERDYALEDPSDAYHHSKLLQERAAFASRLPVVAILPTAPIGANDWKPTPTGNMILEYARGKMFAKPPGHGGMNLVAVEDVARAHIAALTRGRINERYVIGGENLTMDAIWETLATITGIPAPSRRAPYGLALAVAYADRIRCTVTPHATPFAPLEGVRMSRDKMFANDAKARTELGHTPTQVRAALERAIAWYQQNGYTAPLSS